MRKSYEVSLHEVFFFSHTTWTRRSIFSMNSRASLHIPQSCSVELHCFYVRDQLSSCIAAVSARVPAARDRSSSGLLGVSLVGLVHHLEPPDRLETGLFGVCKNVTLFLYPFFNFSSPEWSTTPLIEWTSWSFIVVIISFIICPSEGYTPGLVAG